MNISRTIRNTTYVTAAMSVAIFLLPADASASVRFQTGIEFKQTMPIVKVSGRVKGWDANMVQYPGGAFTQNANGGWTEANNNGIRQFREVNRDEWSVYLRDDAQNVDIQLDLWKKQIFYSDSNTPRRVQYQVVGASGASGTTSIGSTGNSGNSGTAVIGNAISNQIINYNCNTGSNMVVRYELDGNVATANFRYGNSIEVRLRQVPSNIGWQFTDGNYHLQINDTQAIVRQGSNNGDTCYAY